MSRYLYSAPRMSEKVGRAAPRGFRAFRVANPSPADGSSYHFDPMNRKDSKSSSGLTRPRRSCKLLGAGGLVVGNIFGQVPTVVRGTATAMPYHRRQELAQPASVQG